MNEFVIEEIPDEKFKKCSKFLLEAYRLLSWKLDQTREGTEAFFKISANSLPWLKDVFFQDKELKHLSVTYIFVKELIQIVETATEALKTHPKNGSTMYNVIKAFYIDGEEELSYDAAFEKYTNNKHIDHVAFSTFKKYLKIATDEFCLSAAIDLESLYYKIYSQTDTNQNKDITFKKNIAYTTPELKSAG